MRSEKIVLWHITFKSLGPKQESRSQSLGVGIFVVVSVLLLARRLSINFAGNLEERVSGDLSIRVEPKEVTRIPLTRELLAI